MNYTTSVITLLGGAFALIACEPQQPAAPSQELAQLVDELCEPPSAGLAPGTAIAVVKDGQVLINKGFGYANLEHELPITSDTRFDLASVSKQFAGFAISQLIEEGEIAPGDDIRQYIPELHNFGETITVDHLVHHTSGLRDWTSTLPLSGRTFEDVISMDHILRMAFRQRALNFPPGDQYRYSNTGYNLLAELVHRVSGMTFREWTEANIFEPLGMESTLVLDNHSEVIPQRVSGYYEREEAYQLAPNLLTALGSSSMYSTTSDLIKWASFLQESIDKGDPVVMRMLTQGVLNDGEEIAYAYGLSVGDFNGTRWISHSGSWASFRTFIVVMPDVDLSIIVLNNYAKNGYTIASEIAGLFVAEPPGEEEGDAEEPEPVNVAETTLDDYVGTYQLGDTWYVDITREGDQLWTQATSEDNFPMEALSDTVFRVPDYGNRTMTFRRDDQGAVKGLVYMEEERPRMTAPFQYNAAKGIEYVGRYLSEELNTFVSIKLDGDDLSIQHFDHGPIALTPAWTDDFLGDRWWIQSVVFNRDAAGRVTGFRASQYRALNQWFEKVE